MGAARLFLANECGRRQRGNLAGDEPAVTTVTTVTTVAPITPVTNAAISQAASHRAVPAARQPTSRQPEGAGAPSHVSALAADRWGRSVPCVADVISHFVACVNYISRALLAHAADRWGETLLTSSRRARCGVRYGTSDLLGSEIDLQPAANLVRVPTLLTWTYITHDIRMACPMLSCRGPLLTARYLPPPGT